jgi:hypothetical protein
MATILKTTDAPRFVTTDLTYLAPTSVKPTVHTSASQVADSPTRTGEFEQRRVPIFDGRPFAQQFSLDHEGFELHRHKTAVTNFMDDEVIRDVYYPEIAELVKKATGASDVFIFDHTVRIEEDTKRENNARRAPVQVVHNDYTAKSGPVRIRDLLPPDKANAYLTGRFAQINVWRSIGAPVKTTPLAVSDAQSIAPADLVPTDLVYGDRTGEIYQFQHNPAHRWFYFPDMTRHEALLLKGYDSATDGTARFTADSAFANPDAPRDALPRESIEVRTFVSFAPVEA